MWNYGSFQHAVSYLLTKRVTVAIRHLDQYLGQLKFTMSRQIKVMPWSYISRQTKENWDLNNSYMVSFYSIWILFLSRFDSTTNIVYQVHDKPYSSTECTGTAQTTTMYEI